MDIQALNDACLQVHLFSHNTILENPVIAFETQNF